MPYPGTLHPEPLQQSTGEPYIHWRHSNTVLAQSLCGFWVLVHTRFVLALQVSLVGMGFDSKCSFSPSTILLGLLLCPWMWGIFLVGYLFGGYLFGGVSFWWVSFWWVSFWWGIFLVGTLSMVVQQQIVILEFLQEKMSTQDANCFLPQLCGR